jgi:hypothetical protein
MLGSNNEVAVLDAVLGSLAKSPAFAEFEAPVPEAAAKYAVGFSVFMAHIEKMEDEDSSFLVAGDFFNEQMPLTDSESAEMDEMTRLLNQ